MTRIVPTGPVMALALGFTAACGRSDVANKAGTESGAADSSALAAAPANAAQPKVANVMIGRRVGAGNRIIEPTFEFAPADTVYVSVTAGGTGTLTAAWRSQGGQVIRQVSEPIADAGDRTVFSLAEPKGLKPGTYKVILFLGEDSVDTKVFAVRK